MYVIFLNLGKRLRTLNVGDWKEVLVMFQFCEPIKVFNEKPLIFVVPCDAYLPQAYTDDNNLETYFSVSDDDLWFVDDKYLRNRSDTKAWLQFLKAIGSMDAPLTMKKKISRTSENYQEFNAELTKRNIESEYTTQWVENNILKTFTFNVYRRF